MIFVNLGPIRYSDCEGKFSGLFSTPCQYGAYLRGLVLGISSVQWARR